MRQGPVERTRAPAALPPRAFVDLAGASGAVYRFERIDDLAKLPAIAGNFVYMRGAGKAATVICVGAAESLFKAGDQLPEAKRTHNAEGLYIRRNVSRLTRGNEHADIVEKHHPVMILAAEFDRAIKTPQPSV